MDGRILVCWLLLPLALGGCSTKFVPDNETELAPPVAFQQQFVAEALDSTFRGMDFSRLRGKRVTIELTGIYPDTDVEDYIIAMLRLELAKAGAITEETDPEKPPDYTAIVMLRIGGVNDVVRSAVLYEWRQKHYAYEAKVAVLSAKGEDYFVQSGKGATEVTIARRLYLLFFPIPLPCEYSRRKGFSWWGQVARTYGEYKRRDRAARHDWRNVPAVVQ